MATGIDVDDRRIVVTTGEGTTDHHNGVLRVEEPDEETLSATTEHASYLIGDDAAAAAEAPEGLDPVLGGESNLSEDARRATAEAFLGAAAGEDGPIRYVTRPRFGADPLSDVLRAEGRDGAEVDAGLAVGYDVLDDPVTGIGVAVFEGSVTATVAAGGMAVATETIDASDDWYNYWRIEDGATDEDVDRLSTAWATMQYETLFSDLAAALAGKIPGIEGPLPVAIGGGAAPERIEDRVAEAMASELPVEVGSVTVADDPDAAPARGALVAAEAADGAPTATPAYAEEVPHGTGPTDAVAAVESLGGGVARVNATAGTTAGPGRTEAATTDGEVDTEELRAAMSNAHADLSKLERRSAKTARALSELIGQLGDIAAGAEGLSEVREDIEGLQDRVSAETDDLSATVERLDGAVGVPDREEPIAEAVADLESSLTELQDAVAELDDDTTDLRSAIASVDESVDVDFEGPMDEIRGLEEDIDVLEDRLEEQLDYLWDEVNDVQDDIVEINATVEDVPELEQTVGRAQDAVSDLEDEVGTVRGSVSNLGEELTEVRERMVEASRVGDIETELDNMADKLERLRRELGDSEEVDPERIDELETTLDGLRKTMISQGERIDELEEEKERLNDRIDTVYQNSAKSEALSSLETEVGRIRQTVSNANTNYSDLEDELDDLNSTVRSHTEEIGTLSTNVDNLAGNAVTRSEMNSELNGIENRMAGWEDDIDAELDELWEYYQELAAGGPPDEDDGVGNALTVQSIGLMFVGILGAVLGAQAGFVFVGAAFIVLVTLPGLFAWLLS